MSQPVLPCVHSPIKSAFIELEKLMIPFFDIYVIVNMGGIVSDFEISDEIIHYLF
jgi:hypothetical protein